MGMGVIGNVCIYLCCQHRAWMVVQICHFGCEGISGNNCLVSQHP